jgi:hypothetical protein
MNHGVTRWSAPMRAVVFTVITLSIHSVWAEEQATTLQIPERINASAASPIGQYAYLDDSIVV